MSDMKSSQNILEQVKTQQGEIEQLKFSLLKSTAGSPIVEEQRVKIANLQNQILEQQDLINQLSNQVKSSIHIDKIHDLETQCDLSNIQMKKLQNEVNILKEDKQKLKNVIIEITQQESEYKNCLHKMNDMVEKLLLDKESYIKIITAYKDIPNQIKNFSIPIVNMDRINYINKKVEQIESNLESLSFCKTYHAQINYQVLTDVIQIPKVKYTQQIDKLTRIQDKLECLEVKIINIDQIKKRQNQNFLNQMTKYEKQQIIYQENISRLSKQYKVKFMQLDALVDKNSLQQTLISKLESENHQLKAAHELGNRSNVFDQQKDKLIFDFTAQVQALTTNLEIFRMSK